MSVDRSRIFAEAKARLAALEKRIAAMEASEAHKLAIVRHMAIHRARKSIRDKLTKPRL